MFPESTILNYLFWMAMGALQVPLVLGLRQWVGARNPNTTWWQLALLYGCFLSFCLVLAGGMTLAGEFETRAGLYFIGVLGLGHVVAGALLTRLFVFTKHG